MWRALNRPDFFSLLWAPVTLLIWLPQLSLFPLLLWLSIHTSEWVTTFPCCALRMSAVASSSHLKVVHPPPAPACHSPLRSLSDCSFALVAEFPCQLSWLSPGTVSFCLFNFWLTSPSFDCFPQEKQEGQMTSPFVPSCGMQVIHHGLHVASYAVFIGHLMCVSHTADL